MGTIKGQKTGRSAARGAVRSSERALAPDLARGLMLLLIVVSNSVFFLWAAEHGPSSWHPVEGSTLDRVAQFLMIMMLDVRVYPLFAFLFGYGMMQLYLRQTGAGTSEKAAVGILRKRSFWLIVFGFLHAALLLAGDIIGSYGVLSLVLGFLFLRRGNGVLLFFGLVALVATFAASIPSLMALADNNLGPFTPVLAEPPTVGYGSNETNAIEAAGSRVWQWLQFTPLALLGISSYAAMLLGLWAARRRVLEEPHNHLRLLGWTAGIGITIGWLGGLPAALAHIGVWNVPDSAVAAGGALRDIQEGTGIFAGLGYVALFGLVVHWMSDRAKRSAAVVAVTAVGKRSLSCYLAHSLLISPVLAAWGFGLGQYFSSATMIAYAVACWLVTVVWAYAMERAGYRGPAEVALRRLIYGRT